MLFEPSGVLRSDYGAYCHALGFTEREEVYRSIFTSEERRQEKEVKYLEAHSPSDADTNADAAAFLSFSQKQSTIAAATAAVTPNTVNTTAANNTPASAGRKGRKASTVNAKSKKKGAATEDPAKALENAAPLTLTFIVMRQLKFCLNRRDIKPLALAIPHCVSLVSVEFVGCGLSEESYFLLVEALYKSRRVASVTIDFNSSSNPGFYVDPVLSPGATFQTANQAAVVSFTDVTPELALSQPNTDSLPGSSRRSVVPRNGGPTLTGEDLLSLREQPGLEGPTFAPSEYRGLRGVLLSLEQQSREEKGRKGKVDSKKQTQLQQQLDSLAQIDRENPVTVPRGWASMLLTGVKHLSLRGNGITSEDVALMASLLLRHPRSELVSLNLWGNRIDDEGAVALAKLLKENRTLQVLDLGHNDIADVGLLTLVDCFCMQEMPLECLLGYRKRQLLRRDATARERQLASTPPPTYPSYQELYTAWHQAKYPALAEEKKESKKGAQTKTKKAEPLLVRPTSPFDRDCFRMENSVRVPGNTVLRCVNLGNNPRVTLDGAREALRVLSLHEPSDDKEMSALQNCVVQPPELYCASIKLHTFVILHDGDPGLRAVQKELSDMLYKRLLLLPQAPAETEVPGDDPKRKSPRAKK
ncbi:hypothetical protein TCDM_02662 [Trypanosoma cruzi Dm28c]|uniref:Leucine-rich repeat protein (LRRP) n=1 Tax=Trypanosoma cruzi Dm28c TaxID=1416333 RepID=V5BVG4_TRYCR|nr:hypothetical protein TCDM_02662 [Trypanosoma cruzi Dm28c]